MEENQKKLDLKAISRKTGFSLPSWVFREIDPDQSYHSDEKRMRFAIELSRLNVQRKTGGPFGAAIFDNKNGNLLGLGVNRVIENHDPTAHAEIIAIRTACQLFSTFSLGQLPLEAMLYSSSEPCAMCGAAILWSGVSRVFCAASRSDVEQIGFQEGGKIEEWYQACAARGMEVTSPFFREEAKLVLKKYHEMGGRIYNG